MQSTQRVVVEACARILAPLAPGFLLEKSLCFESGSAVGVLCSYRHTNYATEAWSARAFKIESK